KGWEAAVLPHQHRAMRSDGQRRYFMPARGQLASGFPSESGRPARDEDVQVIHVIIARLVSRLNSVDYAIFMPEVQSRKLRLILNFFASFASLWFDLSFFANAV